MTFKKAVMAAVAATSIVAMPAAATASASQLSLRSAPSVERAGAVDADESRLGGGSVIIAILAAAAVVAAILVAADGDDDSVSA